MHINVDVYVIWYDVIHSCADCGTVVINSLGLDGEDQELLYASEDRTPLHAICVEDALRKRKDKAFIVGTSHFFSHAYYVSLYIVHCMLLKCLLLYLNYNSVVMIVHSLLRSDFTFSLTSSGTETGQLIYRRHSWPAAATSYKDKDQKELFPGCGSAVTSVTWRGSVVAWADSSHVRLMEVHSQTAICYLNCPPNIGVNNPFPCSLFWYTDMDLLIGWADSFRQLHLVQTGLPASSSSSPASVSLRARLTADWVTDSIICSVSSFDKDHALLLGYIPPSVDMYSDNFDDQNDGEGVEEDDEEHQKACIELLCVQMKDGQILSADLLPLQTDVMGASRRGNGSGTMFDDYAPENFRMLSSYACLPQRSHAAQWSYKTPFQRGGYRNLPPKLFILSPSDLVTFKVK